MRLCSHKSFVIQLHLQKKWVQGFLNESLQIAFPNKVLISKFHDESAKVNSPSESGSEERGGVSRREGRSQQSSLTFKGEWHNTACSDKSCFWEGKKGVFYTTNEKF